MLNNITVDETIIYLRKSRKDYEFSDEPIEKTLERHEKILQEYAIKSFGTKIPEANIFREVVSGDTIADRPKMQEVLSLIEDKSFKAVLVLEIERLARGNTIDQGIIAQTFEYSNTLIITPQKVFNLADDMDRSFFEDGLYQSRKYLLYTKKILTRGRVASVREGKYIGSITPFGYDKEKIPNEKGFKLTINEEEAKVIRTIFDMYINDNGTSEIANHLNKIGAISKTKRKWTPAMVRNILRSTAVNGKVTWDRRKQVSYVENGTIKKSTPVNDKALIIKGLHEPIINDELWNRVQNKIKINRTPKPPETIKNPLSGVIKCKICGHNMIRRPYGNGHKDILMCPIKGCNVATDLDIVENKLINELEKILVNYKNTYKDNAVSNNVEKYDNIISDIKSEIESDKSKLKRIYELFEDGIYNNDEFYSRRNSIKESIKDREKYLNIMQKKAEEEKQRDYSNLVPKMEYALKLYNRSDISTKNEILKSLIEETYYYKANRGTKSNKENITKFVLEIILKI